jgi:hypothetical protein
MRPAEPGAAADDSIESELALVDALDAGSIGVRRGQRHGRVSPTAPRLGEGEMAAWQVMT